MNYKVLIPQDIAQEGKDFLLEKGYEVKVGSGTDEATVISEGKDADAVLLRTSVVDRKILESLPNVKIVARHGVGFDNVDIQAAADLGIWVTNTPLSNAKTVAETTFALILTAAKNIIDVSQKMREGDFFYKNQHKGMDLEGKKLGILGFGRIGKMVAKQADAFDMEVLVYDPFVSSSVEGFPNIKIVDREELFKQADIVTLHLPSTDETKNSIGEKEFSLMKESAYFINLARGEIVNEPELISALKNKQIRGAVLDVFSQEPLPMDHPLFDLENVILTPHIASNTEECMARMALHAAMEIDRVLSGEKPSWPVNSPQR
ncbi:hydroxyacid dehydrogenase [Cytobacillus gottheilii]|uniref:Hydroxyacid dehydrogenase n=1 Tax=Cytobacillus gottheilii TaxID=859144 RepID=A0ABX8FEC8_9BACI|nr:hydroxyacid dehydrogenase [Cytobacillus gottheilii]QVY62364.1 hydroxyacid dehydrogenase [Cytobacillus gottheilii]